jgi:hypothetical protein
MRGARCGGLIGLVAVAAMVAGALPASAAPGDGSAYGLRADVELLGQPAVHIGPLAPSHTDGPTDNELVAVEVPGVLLLELLNTSAHLDEVTGHVESRASVADLTIGALGGPNTITAELIVARCSATQDGNFGSVNLANVDLGNIGDVPADVEPNTVIEVGAAPLLIARITLNEQIENDDGSLTVNAIHIELLNGIVGTGDIVISSATCGPAGPPVPMASGAGLWLSLGMIGMAVIPAGIVFANRRRTAITDAR